MSTVAPKEFSDLTALERQAILKLLDDDDSAVQGLLVEQLVSYGPAVLDWLLPLLPVKSGVMRRRIELVETRLGQQGFDKKFLEYCVSPEAEMDLEDGVWCLAQTEYPLICVDGYRALLDSFAEVLRERLDGVENGDGIVAVINEYLFSELGFSGNDEDYYDPANSYLNAVIDRRLGIPISLSVVLLLISSRLQLPVKGIGMPGHFLCRFQTSREEFYIDAFNSGRILSKSECVSFLNGSNFGYRDEFLAPVSPRAILLRVCQNLLHIHSENDDAASAARFQRYVSGLSRMR